MTFYLFNFAKGRNFLNFFFSEEENSRILTKNPMNPDNRKLSKDKAHFNNSVDRFVISVKEFLNGRKEKFQDIHHSINEINISSSSLIEELRKQTKYNK